PSRSGALTAPCTSSEAGFEHRRPRVDGSERGGQGLPGRGNRTAAREPSRPNRRQLKSLPPFSPPARLVAVAASGARRAERKGETQVSARQDGPQFPLHPYTRRHPVGVLRGDVHVLLGKGNGGAEGHARGVIELRPVVIPPLNQRGEQNSGDRTVRHAVCGVTRGDVDI